MSTMYTMICGDVNPTYGQLWTDSSYNGEMDACVDAILICGHDGNHDLASNQYEVIFGDVYVNDTAHTSALESLGLDPRGEHTAQEILIAHYGYGGFTPSAYLRREIIQIGDVAEYADAATEYDAAEADVMLPSDADINAYFRDAYLTA